MKTSRILMFFLVGIISISLALASFFIFDYDKAREELKNNRDEIIFGFTDRYRWRGLETYKNEIGRDVDRLDIEVANGDIEVEYGDRFYIEVDKNGQRRSKGKSLVVERVDKTLKVYDKDKNMDNISFDIKIIVPRDKKVSLDLTIANGDIQSKVDLENLKGVLANGSVELSGDKSYDMDIELINGDVDLEFREYDASFDLDILTGEIELFDDSYDMFDIGEGVKKVVGDGKDSIKIYLTTGGISVQ